MAAIPMVKLAEYVDLLAGFAFDSANFTNDPADIPLVKGENVSQGSILWGISKRWSVAEWSNFEKYQLQSGDVIVAMDRPWVPAGLKWAYIRKEDPKALLVQRCSRLRSNSTKLDQDFLRFVVGGSGFESYIKPITTGVNVPHISGRQILDYEFLLPTLPVQQRIASILSAYDELIENCQQRVKIFEAMARALYREWFVYFRFPGHESAPLVPSSLGNIPQGWQVKRLGEVTQFKSGYAFKGEILTADGLHRLVTIKNVQDGVFIPECGSRMNEIPEKMPSFCVLNDGDILLSLTGNVGRVCLVFDGPFLLNQRVSKLLPVEETDGALVYCMFREPSMLTRLEQVSNGVAQQNLSPIVAAQLDCIHPPDDLRLQFSHLVEPMVQRIVQLQSTIQNLRATRDALLPRLLSGQIDVEAMAS